ncbi:MAG: hypothetical protein AAF799_19905 [Myxococcota bacterium]
MNAPLPRPAIALCDLLDAIDPALPTRLVSEESRAAMRRVACCLPAVSTAGFEVVLGEGRGRADFAIRATPEELTVPDRAEASAERRAWDRVATLVGDLNSPQQVEAHRYDRIHELWLEFDVGRRQPHRAAVPSVFLGLARWQTDAHDFRQGAPASATMGLQCLADGALPPTTRRTLDRCFRALQDGQHVLQVGAMLSRPDRGARVVVRGFEPATALAYLQRIGWPGEPSSVASHLHALMERSDDVALSIDIAAGVGPRLGLETSPLRGEGQGPDARSLALLEHFVATGTCPADEAAALRAFCGRTDESAPTWPGRFRGLGRFGLPQPSLERRINHFKLVLHGRRPPLVKAYFGFHLHWAHRAPTV